MRLARLFQTDTVSACPTSFNEEEQHALRNLALVTGASSGIGRELARVHAAHGGDLILVARSESKLQALQSELQRQYGCEFRILVRDLALSGAAEQLWESVQASGDCPDVLINNAGVGGHGALHRRNWHADKAMIHLNVLTLAGLTRLALEPMVARGCGRILNVASTAAFFPGPLMATYFASKAFVLSLGEAVAEELCGTGVTLTTLCPGPVRTGFGATAAAEDSRLFHLPGLLSDQAVARYGYRAMLRGRRLAVPGVADRLLVHVIRRLTPRRAATRVTRFLNQKTPR
jgi:short-subunit dehydrogenase